MIKDFIKEIIKKIRDVLVSFRTGVYIGIEILDKNKPRCLLITNGMGFGGAPLVLMEAAYAYKKLGYNVVICTEYYGNLIKLCRKNGIFVWIVPKGSAWLKNFIIKVQFSFALVNTVVQYEWISTLNKNGIPVLWWLHEGDSYIQLMKNVLPKNIPTSVNVLTVSKRTQKSLEDNGFKYKTEMMHYGLKDLKVGESKKYINNIDNEDYRILVMGAICKRKNQLFALQAYRKLDLQLQKKIKLLFVGEPLDEYDAYYIEFMENINKENGIEYIPRVDRDRIPQLYDEIDALICCSIDDPLPVVVTECLMFSKTVIISSETGQYPLIQNGKNGFSFVSEDIDDLCEKIKNAYNARNDIKLAENARLVYENYFTKEIFQNNLQNYTKKLEERKKK